MKNDLLRNASVRAVINDIHMLGIAPIEFADRFIDLLALAPDDLETQAAIDKLDLSPLEFEPELELDYYNDNLAEHGNESDVRNYWEHWQNWYGYRFGRRIGPCERVFVRGEAAEMFWLLAGIYALAFPTKAALWSKPDPEFEQKQRELLWEEQNIQRYLKAHGRVIRPERKRRVRTQASRGSNVGTVGSTKKSSDE